MWEKYVSKVFKASPTSIKQIFTRSGLFSLLFVFILIAIKHPQLHRGEVLGLGLLFSFVGMFLFQSILCVTKKYLDTANKHPDAIQIVNNYGLRKRDYQQLRKAINKK